MVSVPTGEPAVDGMSDIENAPAFRSTDSSDAPETGVRRRRRFGDGQGPIASGVGVWWFAAALAPWIWFLIRDTSGWLDFFAIFMPILVGAALILAARIGWKLRTVRVLPVLLSLAAFGFATVVAPMLADPTGPPTEGVRVTTANLESYWFSDNDFDWFLETHPTELVVVIEMQLSHRDVLRARFEHHVDDVIEQERFRIEPDPDDSSYKRFGFPSIGVYSDLPLRELEDTTGIEDGMPGFRLQVDLPSGPVVLYALHVPKPAVSDGQYQVSLGEQRAMADAIADSVRREELPVIVLGDLNMVDRGSGYRSLRSAGLADGMLAEGARPTSDKGGWHDLLRLRIDHLLISDGELCSDMPRYDPVAFADHVVTSALVGPCDDG